MRLALAQINTCVGDLEGNLDRALAAVAQARDEGADVIVLPELTLPGYPAEDLLLRPDFVAAQRRALDRFAAGVTGGAALVGFVDAGEDLFNAVAMCAGGEVRAVYRKQLLPNYGVFDEKRYFAPGSRTDVVRLGGTLVGMAVCEDLWYPEGPLLELSRLGARVVLSPSASPYARGKGEFRERMLATRAADAGCFLAVCNLVGGQDELVFDGHSTVFGPTGELLARGAAFAEDLVLCDVDPELVPFRRPRDRRREPPADPLSVELALGPATGHVATRAEPPATVEAEVHAALVLGLRDYVDKNRFPGVLVGLSGGIDSALTASLCVDALGPERVVGVGMPSPYSSAGSVDDARSLAANLGIRFDVVPIEPAFTAYREMLAPLRGRAEPAAADLAEENLQARIRGTLLMTMSNALGLLVITTGNKSESATGYSTLYGDTAGGFAILKDVPKTLVYRLARWRNERGDGERIPEATLSKAPSAELRPGQTDQDSLPPYEVLDPLVEGYVEQAAPLAALAALPGLDATAARRLVGMIDRAEYKRRQNPPGLKISTLAFGKERRMPITNRYRPG